MQLTASVTCVPTRLPPPNLPLPMMQFSRRLNTASKVKSNTSRFPASLEGVDSVAYLRTTHLSHLHLLLLRTLQIVSVACKRLGVCAYDEVGGHGAHVLDGDAPHGRIGVHDETQHDLEEKVDGK